MTRLGIALWVAVAGGQLFAHVAMGQGALTPPGPPGPTMVTLKQLHEVATNTESNVSILTNMLPIVTNLGPIVSATTNMEGDVYRIKSDVSGLTNSAVGIQEDMALVTSGMDQLGAITATLTNAVSAIHGMLYQVLLLEQENNAMLKRLTNSL